MILPYATIENGQHVVRNLLASAYSRARQEIKNDGLAYFQDRRVGDGAWLLERQTQTGDEYLSEFANLSNNGAKDETSSWSDRAVLVYAPLDTLTGV